MTTQPDRRAAGELEAEILGVLWANPAGLGAAEILGCLGGDMAYTTVAKVLDRLHAKGQVSRTRAGRSFTYTPVGAESSWVAGQVQRLLGRAGNRSSVLQGFVDGLDSADTAILAGLLDQARAQHASQDRHAK